MSAHIEILVREARPADLGRLVALLDQLFRIEAAFAPDAHRQRRGLEALLARGDRARVLVAEAGGTVVGMLTAQIVVSTAAGGDTAWLEDMVVDAPWRGRGIARRLLADMERWARGRGLARLQLLADRGNAPALALYAGRGWQDTGMGAWHRQIRDD